jgi:hypothetical protein
MLGWFSHGFIQTLDGQLKTRQHSIAVQGVGALQYGDLRRRLVDIDPTRICIEDPHQAPARLKIIGDFVVDLLRQIGRTDSLDRQLRHYIPGVFSRADRLRPAGVGHKEAGRALP